MDSIKDSVKFDQTRFEFRRSAGANQAFTVQMTNGFRQQFAYFVQTSEDTWDRLKVDGCNTGLIPSGFTKKVVFVVKPKDGDEELLNETATVYFMEFLEDTAFAHKEDLHDLFRKAGKGELKNLCNTALYRMTVDLIESLPESLPAKPIATSNKPKIKNREGMKKGSIVVEASNDSTEVSSDASSTDGNVGMDWWKCWVAFCRWYIIVVVILVLALVFGHGYCSGSAWDEAICRIIAYIEFSLTELFK